MKTSHLYFSLLAIAALSSSALAKPGSWTDKEKELIADQERRMKEQVGYLEYNCGVKLKEWSIDWESARKEVAEASKSTSTAGFVGQCMRPFDKIKKDICGDGGNGKQLVADQIDRFHCSFAAPKGDPSLSLVDKKLSFSAAWDDDFYKYIWAEIPELIRDGEYSWQEMQYIKHEEKQIAMGFHAMKSSCGKEIKTTIDWKSFQPVLQSLMPTEYVVASACNDAAYRLEAACSEEGRLKQLKKSKIESITCKYDEKLKKAKVTQKRTELILSTSFEADSYGPIDQFLVKKKIRKKKPKMRKISKAELQRIFKVNPKTRCRQRCQSGCRTVGAINSCRKACAKRCR